MSGVSLGSPASSGDTDSWVERSLRQIERWTVRLRESNESLPNLTSIQGETVTFTDNGADCFWGWDDSADAYENLTKAESQAILGITSSSTDNAVARFDSTAGNIQNSVVTVGDQGDIATVSTDAGTLGPTLELYHNSASPAASDNPGKTRFYGQDTGGNKTLYAEFGAQLNVATDGSEHGCLTGQVMYNGTLSDAAIGGETFLLGYCPGGTGGTAFEYVFRCPSGKQAFQYLESFDSGTQGPSLALWHASPNPAVSDSVGMVKFDGKDSGGNYTPYAMIECVASNVTNGTEAALLFFHTARNGTGTLTAAGYFGESQGFVVGSPTGTDKGTGTVNATTIYANGIPWTSGSGSPEGAVTAPVGSLFSRTDGGAGTSLYVKQSGTGNTGWVGK